MDRELELISDFESCRIDAKAFNHAEHLRLAWSYVRTCRIEEAEARMRDGLMRLTEHVGVRGKYHETMTLAWLRLVAWAVAVSPPAATFEEFSRRHGWLFEKDALLRFYSRERLMSDEARARWVEPDLVALPLSPGRSAGSNVHAIMHA